MVESKKSSFLATLLKERSNKDIPYEDFYDYDKFMVITLEGPDEVYTDKQRRWACSQIDNPSNLTKKQAKEMCKGPKLKRK